MALVSSSSSRWHLRASSGAGTALSPMSCGPFSSVLGQESSMFTVREVQGQRLPPSPGCRPAGGQATWPPHPTPAHGLPSSPPRGGVSASLLLHRQMQTPSSVANSHASFEKPQFPYLLSSLKISYNSLHIDFAWFLLSHHLASLV